MKPSSDDKQYWLDQPGNINKLVYIVYGLCAVLLLADLFYDKHPHFSFESWFGFYAFFGFAAYFFIVNASKLLRRVIKRDEGYYGETEDEIRDGGDSDQA